VNVGFKPTHHKPRGQFFLPIDAKCKCASTRGFAKARLHEKDTLKMLMKLNPVVNAAFALRFFCQKFQSQTVIREKLPNAFSHVKVMCKVYVDEIDPRSKFLDLPDFQRSL